MLIKLFQAKKQVLVEQSPFGWGSPMEHAAGTGAGVKHKDHASAADDAGGNFEKDIGMQQMCLRASLMNGVGSTKRRCQSTLGQAGESGAAAFGLAALADRDNRQMGLASLLSSIYINQRYLVDSALTD